MLTKIDEVDESLDTFALFPTSENIKDDTVLENKTNFDPYSIGTEVIPKDVSENLIIVWDFLSTFSSMLGYGGACDPLYEQKRQLQKEREQVKKDSSPTTAVESKQNGNSNQTTNQDNSIAPTTAKKLKTKKKNSTKLKKKTTKREENEPLVEMNVKVEQNNSVVLKPKQLDVESKHCDKLTFQPWRDSEAVIRLDELRHAIETANMNILGPIHVALMEQILSGVNKKRFALDEFSSGIRRTPVTDTTWLEQFRYFCLFMCKKLDGDDITAAARYVQSPLLIRSNEWEPEEIKPKEVTTTDLVKEEATPELSPEEKVLSFINEALDNRFRDLQRDGTAYHLIESVAPQPEYDETVPKWITILKDLRQVPSFRTLRMKAIMLDASNATGRNEKSISAKLKEIANTKLSRTSAETAAECKAQAMGLIDNYYQRLENAKKALEKLKSGPSLPSDVVERCTYVLRLLADCNENAGIFCEAVDLNEYKDYLEYVSMPMDIHLVYDNLFNGRYTSISEMSRDVDQIWENCRKYNEEGSAISDVANEMALFYHTKIKEWVDTSHSIPDKLLVQEASAENSNDMEVEQALPDLPKDSQTNPLFPWEEDFDENITKSESQKRPAADDGAENSKTKKAKLENMKPRLVAKDIVEKFELTAEMQKENLKKEGPHVGKRIARNFPSRGWVFGTIVAHVSADLNDGLALWHVKHDDGDEEDLETNEVEDALKSVLSFPNAEKLKSSMDSILNGKKVNKRKKVEKYDPERLKQLAEKTILGFSIRMKLTGEEDVVGVVSDISKTGVKIQFSNGQTEIMEMNKVLPLLDAVPDCSLLLRLRKTKKIVAPVIKHSRTRSNPIRGTNQEDKKAFKEEGSDTTNNEECQPEVEIIEPDFNPFVPFRMSTAERLNEQLCGLLEVSQELINKSYNDLSVQRRIDILRLLCDFVADTPKFHDEIEGRFTTSIEIRREWKEWRDLNFAYASLGPPSIDKNKNDLRLNVGTDELETSLVKLRELKQYTDGSLTAMIQKMEEMANKRYLQEQQKLFTNLQKGEMEKQLKRAALREIHLGYDRYYNRYLYLDGDHSRVYMQPSGSPESVSYTTPILSMERNISKVEGIDVVQQGYKGWLCFEGKEALNRLIQALNPDGLRESALITSLKCRYATFLESLTDEQNKIQDPSILIRETQDRVPFVFDMQVAEFLGNDSIKDCFQFCIDNNAHLDVSNNILELKVALLVLEKAFKSSPHGTAATWLKNRRAGWLYLVVNCKTWRDLCQAFAFLENNIPVQCLDAWYKDYYGNILQAMETKTESALACRIFALDRAVVLSSLKKYGKRKDRKSRSRKKKVKRR